MSITAETAKAHVNDPAVLCCRAEAGITIEAANLEDPAIFDELVDSGLLTLDGCLTIGTGTGCKINKNERFLIPVNPRHVEGYKESVPAEEEPGENTDSAATSQPAEINVAGAVTKIQHGKVVISIKEGKDIYLELPI